MYGFASIGIGIGKNQTMIGQRIQKWGKTHIIFYSGMFIKCSQVFPAKTFSDKQNYIGCRRCSIGIIFYRFNQAVYIIVRNSIIRSEEHTSELQSRENLVCRLLLEK